ncbi:MAG: AzlD domain-containing protein [Clostridia bacterium]|nr:AzlD domain-containing protein [Clostridia bacterium]
MAKYIFVMAAVTYLIRMLPLTFFRKQINNIYVKAFLKYIPYAVLSAMTIPDIFYSTGSVYSALAGLACALILSYLEKGLLTVSLAACAVVYVFEQFLL